MPICSSRTLLAFGHLADHKKHQDSLNNMPLPPIFAISGFGGVTLAVTVLVVRRIARNPRKKRKASLPVVLAAAADVSSTTNDFTKSESVVHSCGSHCLTYASNAETLYANDSINARSAAIIESHQVKAATSLLPKTISTLSSVTYDSKVCVDTYAALLTNDDHGDDEDDNESTYDDAKTTTDDLESEALNRMNEVLFEHEETNIEIADLNSNEPVLTDTPPSEGAAEIGIPLICGEYEQSDELLVEPKSPILGQQISSGMHESETPVTVNSEPSFVNNYAYDLAYDGDLDVQAEAESDDMPVPSVFTESASVPHEVEHHSEHQGSAVMILHSPGKPFRARAPVFVTAAPLASVPALEDPVTDTPIPATEISIGKELFEITSETPEPQDDNQTSVSDEQENIGEDSRTTDEESNIPQDKFMSELPTIPEESESRDNESDDVLQDRSNMQTVSMPRFGHIACDSNGPVLPMVSRERSTLSSSERTVSWSPAATRPLCEKDVEHVRAMTGSEAADESGKENTFQSTSTSPERLSRKPWRSERLSTVFSRKNSLRRLRIPDRVRRRQSQKHNAKAQ
ncbi:hypothetical protein FGB62_16g238 [Gracilaria domingensis]|nr:hypothetical protein FGB62_16g238 [Gracilaria domingensis]